MERRRGASIEDVAGESGVSVATVSRALRGLPNVAAPTRRRVEDAAERLSYRPDPSAARLATGRTQLVQLATPPVESWYFSRFLAGAIYALGEAGYESVVHPVESPEQREEFLADLVRLEKRVDGLVLADLRISESTARQLLGAGIPTVTAGFSTPVFPSVVVDDHRVGYLATSHLLELGHRRIGVLSMGHSHPLAFVVPDLRLAGYSAALREHGIETEPELEQPGGFTAAGGREAMTRLLALERPPTAVFAMSDEMAFGARRAMQDLDMTWPADMSVVGVDDHDLADLVDLTTVRLAPRSIGEKAIALLLAQIDDGARLANDGLGDFELIVRGSTRQLQ